MFSAKFQFWHKKLQILLSIAEYDRVVLSKMKSKDKEEDAQGKEDMI